jgi:hypothetical protein
MGTIGIVRNSKKKQRTNAELEIIIDRFAKAMRDAHKPYIAMHTLLNHNYRFTPNMAIAWWEYVEWCRKNG